MGSYLLYLLDKAKAGTATRDELAELKRCSRRAKISFNIPPKRA